MVGSYEGVKLVISDGKVIDTILGNVDVITLGIDCGTELGYLDGCFDGSNDGKLEGLFLGGSLGSTDGKVLGYDEGVKLVLSYGEFPVIILVNVDVITLGLDVGTNMGSLDGSFDGSDYGKV